MIDTEHGSGELYAPLFQYDVARLEPPFQAERYIQLIEEAEKAGYDVLIIDSLSHVWFGQEGLLDLHERFAQQPRSDSFRAWAKVNPIYYRLLDAIFGSKMHVIACFRTKQGYKIIEDQGRTKVVKLGLGPIFREGIEYEFTVVLELTGEHVASSSKDRTGLFDGKAFVPSAADGERLRNWLEAGVEEPPPPPANLILPEPQPEPLEAEEPAKPKPSPVLSYAIKLAESKGISREMLEEYAATRWPGETLESLTTPRLVVLKRTLDAVQSAEEWAEEAARWAK